VATYSLSWCVQALYDTSTPPASSSPAHNADVNSQQNEMMPQHGSGSNRSSGPETVAELQRSFNADISDERLGEANEPDGNTSTW